MKKNLFSIKKKNKILKILKILEISDITKVNAYTLAHTFIAQAFYKTVN